MAPTYDRCSPEYVKEGQTIHGPAQRSKRGPRPIWTCSFTISVVHELCLAGAEPMSPRPAQGKSLAQTHATATDEFPIDATSARSPGPVCPKGMRKSFLRNEDASHGRYEDQQFAIKVLATLSVCEACGRYCKKEQQVLFEMFRSHAASQHTTRTCQQSSRDRKPCETWKGSG